jgi:hypothetical protein
MSLDAAIARFRQRQADLFRDEATVDRPAGTGSLNTTTGEWAPSAGSEVYSGPCLIRAFVWEGTDVFVGGTEVRLRRVRAKFPADTDIQVDDVIVPTSSTYDESLIGVSFRVTDAFRDGWQIVRTCIAEEVTGDE